MPDRCYADEWLPSRFSLGTLRLLGYGISRALETRRPTSGAFLNHEPHQQPLEATLLSLAYWLIPGLQLTLLVGRSCGWRWYVLPIAFAAMLAVVPVVWAVVAFLFTPAATVISGRTGRSTHDIQSLVTPTGMLALAVASVMLAWPGALLGWLWICLTVVEVASSLVCLALRRPFAALESRFPPEAP
jgi:hypothetical protein